MLSNCPACGSTNYVDTIAVESCPDCGIECNYHGGGINAAWAAWEKRVAREERILADLQRDSEYD